MSSQLLQNGRALAVYKVKTGAYRAKWELYIGGRKNLDRFYRAVGFSHPQKKMLLKKALQSYKQLMDFKTNGLFYTITPKVW